MSDQKATDSEYESFVELFTASEPALRGFVRSLVPGWHDADEVVQEVALTAWKKFEDFEQGSSFLSWVCTIARFKALSYRRNKARDRLCFSDELIELMAEEGMTETNSRKQEYRALEKCLAKLSEKQRRWIMISYTPGLSVKEEAEKAGVNPGTIYMRTNRIRKVLFDCINQTLKAT